MPEKTDAFCYPPRVLSLDAAARYLSISTSKFSALVAEGRLPKPKKIDKRSIWDRIQLDQYVDDLPQEHSSPRDEFLKHFPLAKK